MTKIGKVSKGPKGLVAKLNEIIDGINNIALTQGRGISITATATGWIINADDKPSPSTASADPGTAPSAGGGSGGTSSTGLTDTQTALLTSLALTPAGQAATWQVLNVVVQTETGYELQNVYYWGGAPFGP